jgi:hypothetical protein
VVQKGQIQTVGVAETVFHAFRPVAPVAAIAFRPHDISRSLGVIIVFSFPA